MNAKPFDRDGDLASNFLIVALSLSLIAGYACLLHVFQSDRQEGRAAMVEQSEEASVSDSLSHQDLE